MEKIFNPEIKFKEAVPEFGHNMHYLAVCIIKDIFPFFLVYFPPIAGVFIFQRHDKMYSFREQRRNATSSKKD